MHTLQTRQKWLKNNRQFYCGRNGASYVRPITQVCCLIEVDSVVNIELVFVKVTTILSRLICL